MQASLFTVGDLVEKYMGTYTGSGIVRSAFRASDGVWRYNVGHRIEGGTGELLHVYAEGQLRLLTSERPFRKLDPQLRTDSAE